MIVYFETSAFVKLLVEEEGSDTAASLWDDAEVALSSLLTHVEARAALASARRGGRLSAKGFMTAKHLLERRWSQLETMLVTEHIVRHAGDLAEGHGLRGYDAVHLASCLEAAGATGFLVATSDADLTRAANAEGLLTA